MIRVKKFIETVLEQAASRAFPIIDKCKVEKAVSGTDYHSELPKELFTKYKTGIHTFGMFNEREIADSIFANCQKNEVMRAVQVSGLGNLQIFINDKFISRTVNKIIEDQEVKIEKTELSRPLFLHILNNVEESQTLAYYRTELLINSLTDTILAFGSPSVSRKLLLNNENCAVNPQLSQLKSLNTVNVPSNLNIKTWIQQFSSALEEKNQFSSIFYLFNSYNSEIFMTSQALPAIFSVFAYGSLFKCSDFFVNSELMPIDEEFLCLSSDQREQKAIFHYNLLRVPRSSCDLIVFKPLEKSLNSVWSALNVFRQLRVDGNVEFINENDVQDGLRPVLMHAITLPDVLSTCISSCSMHHLIIWIEKYSELYINTHSNLTPSSLNTLNFLSKQFLSYTLSLLHIDIQKFLN